MKTFERTLILGKIHDIPYQSRVIYYVPELISLQSAADSILLKEINEELTKKIQQLKAYQQQWGLGMLPMKFLPAKEWMENLYISLLKNHIPLPATISENDLKYQLTNSSDMNKYMNVVEHKIKIPSSHLTLFAKLLPRLGNLVTLTITIGLTASTLGTLVDWGWPLMMFATFGACRLLTNYADTAGGPERRLQLLGFWLDRVLSQCYTKHGKSSRSQKLLNLIVTNILACSSLLSWYAAWQMVCCLAGSYLPFTVSYGFTSLFALSSVGSSFGRIHEQLYQILYAPLSPYLDFDTVHTNEKLDFATLANKWSTQPELPLEPNNAILFRFNQSADDNLKTSVNVDKPRNNIRSSRLSHS